MANKFTNVAKRVTSLSPLMAGRNQLKVDEIIERYPDGFTLNEFDMVTVSADTFPVFTIKEDDSVFAYGGVVLHGVINAWIDLCDGDIEQTSREIKNEGGVRMKFVKSRTKSGNNVTLVEVLD